MCRKDGNRPGGAQDKCVAQPSWGAVAREEILNAGYPLPAFSVQRHELLVHPRNEGGQCVLNTTKREVLDACARDSLYSACCILLPAHLHAQRLLQLIPSRCSDPILG